MTSKFRLSEVVRRGAFLTTLFVCTFQISKAQLSIKYKGYEDNYYQSMRYGYFKPENYDNKKLYPLIVYLHGSRDTVSRDNNWYQPSIQNKHPCFVLTPKCLVADQGWGNTWSNTHTVATSKVLSLVDSLIKNYPIDPARLYLYGISMGGFGAFSILQKNAGMFAAAYVVCGGGSEKAVNNMVHTPLWIFHGAIDDVVDPKYSRQVYDEIQRLGGGKVRYTEYPGVRHNSWENVANEETLSTWLFMQKKDKAGLAPGQPSQLKAESSKDGSIILTWNKSPDYSNPDQKIWYYKVFRDSTFLAEVKSNETSFTNNNPKKGSEHSYYLKSVNYFFNESKPAGVVVRE